MAKVLSALPLHVAVLAATLGLAASAHADVLYSSMAGTQTTQFTFYGNGQQVASPTNPSFGDDYYTGYSYINVTGMSFFGGLQATASADHLIIDFYNAAGQRYASVYPEDSTDHGVGVHTLISTDFNQNGSTGLIIPGSGYVLFSPDTYTTSNVNTGVVTPGDPNPIPFTLGFGQLATVGVNDSTLGATVNNSGTLSQTAYVTSTPLQVVQFELDGTGYGQKALQGDANGDGKVDLTDLNIVLNNLGTSTNLRTNGNFDGAATIDLTDLNDVLNNLGTSLSGSAVVATPEPVSMALLAPAALLLLRRRRA